MYVAEPWHFAVQAESGPPASAAQGQFWGATTIAVFPTGLDHKSWAQARALQISLDLLIKPVNSHFFIWRLRVLFTTLPTFDGG